MTTPRSPRIRIDATPPDPTTTDHAREFFHSIDWKLLRMQKKLLLTLTSPDEPEEPESPELSPEHHEALEGVILLIDEIQDIAADKLEFPEEDVFGPVHLEDWKYEVANGDTLLGYAEWVERNRVGTTD